MSTEAEGERFKITWLDSGREPQCPPNPNYPEGIAIDAAGSAPGCSAKLPYPAPRCGVHMVKCTACGASAAITAAGRPDDPTEIKMPCILDRKGAN